MRSVFAACVALLTCATAGVAQGRDSRTIAAIAVGTWNADGTTRILPVKAGAKIELAPGGYHLMLFGPKQPFVEGDVVVATARFEKAGNVEIAFRVRGLGAKREAGHHGH